MKKTLVTSALPYANGYTHLGHCAGAFLPADFYVRFLRLMGEPVLYVCGSDEHGAAISISAEQEGVTPREIVDKYHAANAEALRRFGMSFDIFSRTSLPIHHETTQEFFLDALEKGYLNEKEEEQFYDADAGMFLPDRFVEGTCPNCGKDKARGDQCDNCGAYYNQTELKNPISLITGKPPIVKKTTHWYFKLGDFQQQLEEYIHTHKNTWKENVLQQTYSWLKQGLTDRAITRDLNWGIPVPLERAKGKVIYVWFDAPLGYISATKEWAKQQGTPEAWKDWWQNPETEYIAFIGKDNIVFHTIMFPAMLMGRGGYILPQNVPANEFLNLEGQKFSKSRHWGIDLRDFLQDFPEPQHVDGLRYALAMMFPETRDSDFTWKAFQGHINNELADILGNFINRAQFIRKNYDGRVPTLPEKYRKLPEAWKLLLEDIQHREIVELEVAIGELLPKYLHYMSEHDMRLILSLHFGAQIVEQKYRQFRFRDAVTETMNIARAANKYFDYTKPWKTIKTDPDECARTLYICAQAIRALGIAFSPILPESTEKILAMVHAMPSESTWQSIALPLVAEGAPLEQPAILFTKIEDEHIDRQVAKLGKKDTSQPAAPEPQEIITIDDFKKVQLRTATVLEAERIPKSEKLLKLLVDTGLDKRQILAGIGKFYTPEEMIGKTIVVVVNLKPAKLMGQESQGMLLAANMPDGSLALVTPESAGIAAGAEVR